MINAHAHRLLALLLTVALAGCSSNHEAASPMNPSSPIPANSSNSTAIADASFPVPTPTPSITTAEDRLFSIEYLDKIISLRSDEKFVRSVLGEPKVASEPQPLGDGADTFSDMYRKSLRYEGLTLEFLGLSKDSLWLSRIHLDDDHYATSEGIRVGDALQKLIQAYPDIQYLDTMEVEGRPNAKVYAFQQDNHGFHAEFILNEEKRIEQIVMYFLMD